MKTNKGDTPIQNDLTHLITILTSDTDRLSFVVANGGHVNKQVTHHHRHPCKQTKVKKREERCSAF